MFRRRCYYIGMEGRYLKYFYTLVEYVSVCFGKEKKMYDEIKILVFFYNVGGKEFRIISLV